MTTAVDNIAADLRLSRVESAARPGPDTAPPPTVQALALPELPEKRGESSHRSAGATPVLQGWNPLHQIRATLQVMVGEATISVGELLGAKEHQVLTLDREVDAPVDLTIEGKVVARGQLVAVDGHFGVRITELPVALGLVAGN
ncbi:MAG: FliM/FliN family flagellar motor switch protein [Gammaproteobacteria bacterium]|jgi:flagellar motor switch protein FliN